MISATETPPVLDLPRGEVVTYRVRRGDTLYGIARRYGTTAESIARVALR